MFPGFTVTDMRMRQADLLREGDYDLVRRQIRGRRIVDQRLCLDHFMVQVIVSLLAALGL
jgi:hypothetical protein